MTEAMACGTGLDGLIDRVSALRRSGEAAQARGDESGATQRFREGFGLLTQALSGVDGECSAYTTLSESAVRFALQAGDAAEARRLMEEAAFVKPELRYADNWAEFWDDSAWPDAWLLAAVRCEPPDVTALDVLAERYWKPLFGRCYMLTLNNEKAADLAQDAWCRVLRARQSLKPGGNFPAYLATIATNLWRDAQRSSRRAGTMAPDRLAPLDGPAWNDEGEGVLLADVVPDLNALETHDQKLLEIDIDRALERLTPRLRDVVVARFITGESCAEIGRRYGRTEQTVSAWVREAIRIMKVELEEPVAMEGESLRGSNVVL